MPCTKIFFLSCIRGNVEKPFQKYLTKGFLKKILHISQEKMSKSPIQAESEPNEIQWDKIKKAVGDKCACFVLITCTQPSEDGKMEVAMNYEGDETLASFLVDNASQVFDERMQQRESK